MIPLSDIRGNVGMFGECAIIQLRRLSHRIGRTTVHKTTWKVALAPFVCNLLAAWALSPGE